jgi:hypothetical protein
MLSQPTPALVATKKIINKSRGTYLFVNGVAILIRLVGR